MSEIFQSQKDLFEKLSLKDPLVNLPQILADNLEALVPYFAPLD